MESPLHSVLSRASKPRVTILTTLIASLLAPSALRAASSNWNVDAAGLWNAGTSWDANGIPGSTSLTNSADFATFAFTLSADRIVTVDTNRNIGGITFSNTSAFKYTLNSGNLKLSSGG